MLKMGNNEKFEPGNVNYLICKYCKNQRIIHLYNPDDNLYACAVNTAKDGRLRAIMIGQNDPLDSFVGCEKFVSSGLPAHPVVLEKLIEVNSECVSIPQDLNATETSFKFSHKADRFLHKANENSGGHYVDRDKVQLE